MKFVIVNDVDKPCERLVALVSASGLTCRYVDPSLSHWEEMPLNGSETGLDKFGFEWFTYGVEGRTEVAFEKIAASRAKYADGSPREWQGSSVFVHIINF